MLVKPFGPLQEKLPLPLPVNCTLSVVQVNVPPAACAPGTVLSNSTNASAWLVQPFAPVTVST